jgi:uncharacterized protein YecT (DUF1311 family)
MTRFFSLISSIILLIFCCNHAFALDNPDAPDYVHAFQEKAKKYEQAVSDNSDNNRQLSIAIANYQQFLDEEMNQAYRSLLGKLEDKQKLKLEASQKAWVQYRDTETDFIIETWTPAKFGNSSLLSKSAYRVAIVRNRIEQLLDYLRNF